MWKQKISISLGNRYKEKTEDLIPVVKKAGFDGVSPEWEKDFNLSSIVDAANREGLALVSLHAPYGGAADLWSEDESVSRPVLDELLLCLDDAHKYGFPVLVLHVWIGFGEEPTPTEKGLQNLSILAEKAKEYGIRLAFENTEGDGHLAAVMKHFEGNDTAGYCWDSGHEMCYNHSRDLLALYGDRLLVTHLNDNLGISRFDGEIFWTDDLHLLPFDGIADWDNNIQRLRASRPLEYLNFELSMVSKPNRHENDLYGKLSPSEYFALAYTRACRIAWKYANFPLH
ncbi:MAG: sugar phosphate isomerase/epimerase [Ruminococcaceae bacterium]|nr:sugar phosphate isomerase/epimerase [Oscillospiraceae bacterium]